MYARHKTYSLLEAVHVSWMIVTLAYTRLTLPDLPADWGRFRYHLRRCYERCNVLYEVSTPVGSEQTSRQLTPQHADLCAGSDSLPTKKSICRQPVLLVSSASLSAPNKKMEAIYILTS